MKPVCSCTNSAPWPIMARLAMGGLNRYYICPRCGAIREEVCDTAGLVVAVRCCGFWKMKSGRGGVIGRLQGSAVCQQ